MVTAMRGVPGMKACMSAQNLHGSHTTASACTQTYLPTCILYVGAEAAAYEVQIEPEELQALSPRAQAS